MNLSFTNVSVPTSSSNGNSYKCHICHSTYSHPGNFKQHLLKHEREKRGMAGSDGSHLNSVLQSAFGKTIKLTLLNRGAIELSLG